MTSSTPKIGYWIGGALVAVMLLVAWCKRPADVDDTNVVNIPEQQRERIITGRDKQDAQLAIDTLKYLKQLEAHSREINYWKSKYTIATRKGATIEQRYRKTPTLELCDTLLANKEERITALTGEITEHRKDSLNKADLLKAQAGHIRDRNSRIDSLNQLAKAAHEELARKPLKVYATAAFEASPIRNNASLGGTATYDRWLLGYQKGVIENTHEIKAGFLLRVKKK